MKNKHSIWWWLFIGWWWVPCVWFVKLLLSLDKPKNRTPPINAYQQPPMPTYPPQNPQPQMPIYPPQNFQPQSQPAPKTKLPPPKTEKKFSNKYEYIYTEVDLFSPSPIDFSNIDLFDKAICVQEPDNPYDDQAIAVILNNQNIGYLYKGNRQDMANDFLNKGFPVDAFISRYNISENKVSVDLSFPYRNPSKVITCTLVSNKSKDFQESIELINESFSCTLSFDYETERFEVLCEGVSIGYIPKNISKNLDEKSKVAIENINYDDNDRYIVEVAIKK